MISPRKHFGNLAESFVDAGWSESTKSAPDLVYHYTGAAGLEGMLANKRVWLTDFRFMNDATEGVAGMEISRRALRARRNAAKSGGEKALLDKTLAKIGEDGTNFVFSFSERKDDLSQWRGYANEGRGFCLGFDASALAAHSNLEGEFTFGRVSYNARSHEKNCRDAIQNMVEEFSSFVDSANEEECIERASFELSAVLDSFSSKYKHSSFQGEAEWRLNSYADAISKVLVRVRGDRLVPYLELAINTDSQEFPLKEIGIGPAFKGDENRFAVERLCAHHGANVDIFFADSPYRVL